MMRVLLITDAWRPQVNGVVRTLETTISEIERLGHAVRTVTPDMFRTFPCPTYSEIRLAWGVGAELKLLAEEFQPDAIHIATEGPLGLAGRRFCLRHGLPFTTAFHTRFAEYVNARFGIPLAIGYRWLRWFHAPSAGIMAATRSLKTELEGRGFRNVRLWSRGVDTELFQPHQDGKSFLGLPRPVFLYVGRVAVEKNIKAFLELDLPGSKLVVGDGPQLAELRRKYPTVHFAGARQGEDLARCYAASDVFVFPSRTDTFGLVLLEALASGLPVAAYPVPGPLDVIGDAPVGVLDNDLRAAALKAFSIRPDSCRRFVLGRSWSACARQFLSHLAPIGEELCVREPYPGHAGI